MSQFLTEVSMISFPGCKHLIFDRDRIDKRVKLLALPGNCGAYWERDKTLLPDESCAINVQFCDKRGRLNGKVVCLKGMAECSLYEEYTHNVEVDG